MLRFTRRRFLQLAATCVALAAPPPLQRRDASAAEAASDTEPLRDAAGAPLLDNAGRIIEAPRIRHINRVASTRASQQP